MMLDLVFYALILSSILDTESGVGRSRGCVGPEGGDIGMFIMVFCLFWLALPVFCINR